MTTTIGSIALLVQLALVKQFGLDDNHIIRSYLIID